MVLVPSSDRGDELIDLRDGVEEEAAGLRIEVLGPPSVRLEGSPVRFATRHAELSVYLLALAGPGGVEVDTMGRWLWPVAPEHRWGPRLRTVLWQVRNALGDEAWRLQRRPGSLVFELEGAAVDVAEAGVVDLTAGADLGLLSLDGQEGTTPPVLEGWGATEALAELGVGQTTSGASWR